MTTIVARALNNSGTAYRRRTIAELTTSICIAALMAGCGSVDQSSPYFVPRRLDPTEIRVEPQWRPATGLRPDRMTHNHSPRGPYAAVWSHGKHQYLVVLAYPGQELFGTPYDVYLFDRSLAPVAKGEIRAPQDCVPYGLFEIRTPSAKLPSGYRNRWILAIALWPPRQSYVADVPLRSRDPSDDHTKSSNRIYIEPVQWDDSIAIGSGVLLYESELEIRPAELELRQLRVQN